MYQIHISLLKGAANKSFYIMQYLVIAKRPGTFET